MCSTKKIAELESKIVRLQLDGSSFKRDIKWLQEDLKNQEIYTDKEILKLKHVIEMLKVEQ